MIRALVLSLAAAAFGCAAANAQVGWTLEAAAGSALHDPLAASVSSTTGSLSLSYDDEDRWGYASLGTALSGAGPSWASLGAGAWLARPVRGVEAGVLLGGEAFGYGGSAEPSGGGVSGRLLPGLALTRGEWRGELAAGAIGLAASEGDSTAGRLLGETSARLTWSRDGALLSAGGRYLRGETGGHPFAGVNAELRRPLGSVWAEAGAWLGSALPSPRTVLGIGGELRVERRTSLAVAWRQDPSDPLYRNPPRRSWNVLLRRSLGGGGASLGGAPRTPVARVEGGRVTFRLPRRQHPAAPSLISDLTGWRPVPLAASDAEWWTVTLPVPRGVHRYAFRTPQGGTWLPPEEPRESDGFGGYNAVLVVP